MEQSIQIERLGQWPVLCYTVRLPRQRNAHVFLRDDQGIICIDTDFGQQDTYSHWWGMAGRSTRTLREFLVSTNEGYLCDKFSYGKQRWSLEKAEREIKERCQELIKSGEMTEDDWEQIESELLGAFSYRTANEFGMAAMNFWDENEAFARHFGFDYFAEEGPGGESCCPKAAHMVELVLRPLREFWREELARGD